LRARVRRGRNSRSDGRPRFLGRFHRDCTTRGRGTGWRDSCTPISGGCLRRPSSLTAESTSLASDQIRCVDTLPDRSGSNTGLLWALTFAA
jgi:hypothetical protein